MREVDLDPVPDASEPEAFDGDDRAGRAASGARFEREFLAHRRDPLQGARRAGAGRGASPIIGSSPPEAPIADRSRIRIGRREGDEAK